MTDPRGRLAVQPVGGVGEMGHHHLVLDVGADSFLIDCGMLMPAPGDVGVERITPSLEPALARVANGSLRGLLLTHGHLDHIGAVPDLLAAVRVFAGFGCGAPPPAGHLDDRSIDASDALAALDRV